MANKCPQLTKTSETITNDPTCLRKYAELLKEKNIQDQKLASLQTNYETVEAQLKDRDDELEKLKRDLQTKSELAANDKQLTADRVSCLCKDISEARKQYVKASCEAKRAQSILEMHQEKSQKYKDMLHGCSILIEYLIDPQREIERDSKRRLAYVDAQTQADFVLKSISDISPINRKKCFGFKTKKSSRNKRPEQKQATDHGSSDAVD